MKQIVQKLFILLLNCLLVNTAIGGQDEVRRAIWIIFDAPHQIDFENLKYEDVIKAYKDRKNIIERINSITEQNRAIELRMLLNAYKTILNAISDKYTDESFVDHRRKIAQALHEAVQEAA